jgi:hypothetical protein
LGRGVPGPHIRKERGVVKDVVGGDDQDDGEEREGPDG